MKSLFITASAVAFLAAASTVAQAQARPITTYCTHITENDKSASDGFQLTDAASILRQDRANYHKFGYRDAGDESDSYFRNAGNRARLPDMLANGVTENSVLRKIVRGTPHVCVSVYSDWIDVSLD